MLLCRVWSQIFRSDTPRLTADVTSPDRRYGSNNFGIYRILEPPPPAAVIVSEPVPPLTRLSSSSVKTASADLFFFVLLGLLADFSLLADDGFFPFVLIQYLHVGRAPNTQCGEIPVEANTPSNRRAMSSICARGQRLKVWSTEEAYKRGVLGYFQIRCERGRLDEAAGGRRLAEREGANRPASRPSSSRNASMRCGALRLVSR